VAAQLAPHASLPALGRAFGGLHHTTVLHALRRIGSRANPDACALAASAIQLARNQAELAQAEASGWKHVPSNAALEAGLRALVRACRQIESCAAEILEGCDLRSEGAASVHARPGVPAHAPREAPATLVAADEPIRCRERGCVMPAARHGYCRQHWAMLSDPKPFEKQEPVSSGKMTAGTGRVVITRAIG